MVLVPAFPVIMGAEQALVLVPTKMTTKTEQNVTSGNASTSRFKLGLACRVALGLVLTISGTPLASSAGQQQDAAEAARQERARKLSDTAPPSHVYTNDDLARREILTPVDRSRFVAARAADSSKPEVQAADTSAPAEIPLGDVARYYRAQQQQVAKADTKNTPQVSSEKTFAMTPAFTPLGSMKQAPAATASAPSKSVWPARTHNPFAPVQLPLVASKNVSTHVAVAMPPVATSKLQTAQPKVALTSVQNKIVTRGNSPVLVVEGDTLWSIARKYLGSGYRWKEIVALNPGLEDPRQLRAGAQLAMPPVTL
jgi:nucleoid-associated protein YgaU